MYYSRDIFEDSQSKSRELSRGEASLLALAPGIFSGVSPMGRQGYADPDPQFIPPAQKPSLTERLQKAKLSLSLKLSRLELATDLSEDVGSARWFKGAGTFACLVATSLFLWPNFSPVIAASSMDIDNTSRDEFRSQIILPLALGADSGRHMGATPQVKALAEAPERAVVSLTATLSQGDSFRRMLQRAGVGGEDASRINDLVRGRVSLSSIEPGTKVDISLGQRTGPEQPRELLSLDFRASLDLRLRVERMGGMLTLQQVPIKVDNTPLRIRGLVGSSLYRSARSAGAPASAAQQFLEVLGSHVDMGEAARPTDYFDIIVAHRRSASGESEAGKLLYAGIERNGKPSTQLVRWGSNGQFYEASGVGKTKAGLARPVPGPISSRFGMRLHPVLGYRRMHSGLDFKAGYGTPIVAVSDSTVQAAGRMGGCGNAVRLNHGQGLTTRYCHMSRIAVSGGQRVRRGQIIGYVGSTGLSTGPHLHYEMYRGGRPIDPLSVSYVNRAALSPAQLADFRRALAQLKMVRPGAALGSSQSTPAENTASVGLREIDKIQGPKLSGF